MTKEFKTEIQYALQEDIMLIATDDEIRIRKGVWNYEEACLSLTGYSEEFTRCFHDVFDSLQTGQFSVGQLDDLLLEPFEREQAETVLQQLLESDFILAVDEKLSHSRITKILTGGLELFIDDDYQVQESKSVLFCTDTEYVMEKWKTFSELHQIKADYLEPDLFSALKTVDLTTNIDAIGYYEDMDRLGKRFDDILAIVISVSRLSISFMRNVNRIALEKKIPIMMSFIDGPTINALPVNHDQTGCLECFERRALARLEEHVHYARFVEERKRDPSDKRRKNVSNIILMDLLANISFAGAFMFCTVGASRFSGRLLSIYLPSLEIQMQNILRVPFCEACGSVARAEFGELNASSRRLIDNISERIFKEQ